jgi:hypothetical protein
MFSINDIDFIISHFENTLYPRTMMTKRSNYQFQVNSREEIIQKCLESNLTDCRINAYPRYVKWEKYDIIRYPPNFIFIDLDLENFKKYKNPMKMLDKALKHTLDKISLTFSGECLCPSVTHDMTNNQQQKNGTFVNKIKPTVLWSGNGYHIYLPIRAIVLDEFEAFSKTRFPHLFSKHNDYSVSEIFLSFAKVYFSNGKSDPQHIPKYGNCLIRIPNTLNSKCLNKGLSQDESKVKVIQEWNGYRPPIQLITKEFRRWLYQEEIKQKHRSMKMRKKSYSNNHFDVNNFQIQWIEKLLQVGIYDGRKETLRLVLAPYLIKRKSYDESVKILEKWLDKCEKVRSLERGFSPKQRISNSLKNSKGYLNLDNLRIKNPWLYGQIQTTINMT